jgi:uncharacterized protein YvpB
MLAWVMLVGALSAIGPTGHLLEVPYRDQLDGSAYAWANCGPTSLSMALAYHGIAASPWDLRIKAMQAQQSWVDDEGGYSDSYGVFVYNLATVAEGMGVRTSGLWKREASRIDRLREWQAADLRREIQADHPVIVQVAYRALPRNHGSVVEADHYIVIHGITDADFVYSDPLGLPNGGPGRIISEADLMQAMAEASTPRVGFAVAQAR